MQFHVGERFESGETENDYMFEILPPLWTRVRVCHARIMTGSVTSVFFALRIVEALRDFHAYYDLSEKTRRLR